jgi:hypothetical protein
MESANKTSDEQPQNPVAPVEKAKWYSFIVPSLVGMLMAKLIGLAGTLVAIGIYFGLKSKIGNLKAGVLAVVVGAASAMILIAMIKA